MASKIFRFFGTTCIFFLVFIALLGRWIERKFGEITYKQLMFHIQMPVDGVDFRIILECIRDIVLPIILLIYLYFWLRKIRIMQIVYLIFLFIGSCIVAQKYWNFPKLYHEANTTEEFSDFYEKNYFYPKSQNIIFPHKKRNLIMIIAESMEHSFARDDIFETNLITNLDLIAKQNISFGDALMGGGMQQLYGTSWTIAGIVSYQCGIPLNLPINGNQFGKRCKKFLQGATCLSDILANEQYKQVFLMPHDRKFSGLGWFLKEHGNVEIRDLKYFKKMGLPSDYKGYWGIKDDLNFEFAKQTLLELSKSKEAFALYVLTIDTHAQDGFIDTNRCGDFEKVGGYKGAVMCSDRIISDFVQWAMQQDFYKDTTIVILGDHLSMIQDFFPFDIKDRRVYNAFINPLFFNKVQKERIANRKFSHFDIFPTILDSLNVEIKGGRLGLGVDLMSGYKTILESGIYDEDSLQKRSKIYDSFLLQRQGEY